MFRERETDDEELAPDAATSGGAIEEVGVDIDMDRNSGISIPTTSR
jgi:hypothetical protein